jgi:hypothetical protein
LPEKEPATSFNYKLVMPHSTNTCLDLRELTAHIETNTLLAVKGQAHAPQETERHIVCRGRKLRGKDGKKRREERSIVYLKY